MKEIPGVGDQIEEAIRNDIEAGWREILRLRERKVYLITKNEEVEIALLGPLRFDWAAAVTAFELAEDLYYSRWEIPPEGTPLEVFNAHWARWRTDHQEWLKEREAKFALYNRLLADWLVRHHDFVIVDFGLD